MVVVATLDGHHDDDDDDGHDDAQTLARQCRKFEKLPLDLLSQLDN